MSATRKITELDAMTAPLKQPKKESRDLEDQVARIIKLHFSGPQWTEAPVNFQARNGKTLRQTLMDEKAAKGDKGAHFVCANQKAADSVCPCQAGSALWR